MTLKCCPLYICAKHLLINRATKIKIVQKNYIMRYLKIYQLTFSENLGLIYKF